MDLDGDTIATPTSTPRSARNSRSNVCEPCRRLRRKCDRQTPCSTCVRRKIPRKCRVSSRGDESPRPRISSRPQEPETGYAQSSTVADAPHPAPPNEVVRTPNASCETFHPASTPDTGPGSFASARIGHLWNSRGAASYHGSSYFGHQSAASMMQMESPDLPVGMTGIHASNPPLGPRDRLFHRGGKEPYTHIWELVGCLPRRKAVVDDLVKKFIDELNIVYDGVHKETFQASYDAFWNRKWGDDDLTAVDLRWLSLLFIVLAFAVLVDCPLNAPVETQRACEETSVQFFWASRKAIVLAPTISGESPDLVRAGILVSRYLVYFGRKTESWLTSSFAIRMAQAQGMHVDGESWGLPPKVLETRRRLWCILYSLDRSVSLAIGRPYTVNSKHCMLMKIRNVWLDDMTNEEAAAAVEQPQSEPTRTIYYTYQQQLSTILGDIHDDCFSIAPLTTSYSTYEKVLGLDRVLLSWAGALPPYFSLENPDTSMDAAKPFLYWQRMYLHSSYHFARMTLHRTYVLLESITDRFQYSRDVCISSACADLRLKLGFRPATMADRLKAGGAMHNLFNSALVLGIIAVRDPHALRTAAILEDLTAYCEKERADMWVNEFALAEVKVIELCIASARRIGREGGRQHQAAAAAAAAERRNNGPSSSSLRRFSSGSMGIPADSTAMAVQGGSYGGMPRAQMDPRGPADQDAFSAMGPMGNSIGPYENWLDSWLGPTRNFPEPMEFQFWEDLVGILEAR